MQLKIDFEFAEYVRLINDHMAQVCGMTAHEFIDLIWKDCFKHGLAPADAVEMFLADNAGLLDADE